VASKRLGALSRIKRGALGRGCGKEGSGALPLPRAAAVSTGLRVLAHVPALPGCSPMYPRLQPYVSQAATLCSPGCNPMYPVSTGLRVLLSGHGLAHPPAAGAGLGRYRRDIGET
jgi:hypothetical protein